MSKSNKVFSASIALSAIVEAIHDLKVSTAGALATYRMKTGRLDPAMYAPEYIGRERTKARSEVAVALEAADVQFKNDLLSAARDLRAHIGSIVTRPIPADFLANVCAYQDFGLEITPLEIRAFAASAGECYPALRVLCKVADGAGYRVSFPQITDLERDVDSIERAAELPTLFVPAEYDDVAEEVFPKTNGLLSDGFSAVQMNKEPGTVTGFDTLLKRQQMERFEAEIENIRARWSLPCIIEAESEEKAKGTEADGGADDASENNENEHLKRLNYFAQNLPIAENKTPGLELVEKAAKEEQRAAGIREQYT